MIIHSSKNFDYVVLRYHYAVIKKKYADRAHLLFTDTDSLMVEVETADIYTDMVNSREMYDLSNYPATHPKYNADFVLNRAKVGLMKDEAAGSIITEFVALRPKIFRSRSRSPRQMARSRR